MTKIVVTCSRMCRKIISVYLINLIHKKNINLIGNVNDMPSYLKNKLYHLLQANTSQTSY